jgi:hypothetical protein
MHGRFRRIGACLHPADGVDVFAIHVRLNSTAALVVAHHRGAREPVNAPLLRAAAVRTGILRPFLAWHMPCNALSTSHTRE